MYKLLPILLFALLIAEENQEPNFVQSDSLDFIYAASLLDKLINEFQNQVSNIIDEDKLLIKIDKEIYDIIRADTLILDTLIKTKEKMVNNFPPENLNAWEIRNMSGPSHFIVLKLALEVNVDKSINLNDIYKQTIVSIINNIFAFNKWEVEDIQFNSVDINKLKNNKQLSINRDDIYDDSWAVIIGIDKYEYSDQLNYAVKDAEAVKDMLISKFDFPEKNIRYLTDEEATLSNIKLALDDISSSADANDRVLVFYSGHGETEQNNDGTETGYIIPVEGRQDKPYATGLAMDEILRTCQMSNAKHMLFLMDACYSGLMTENVKGISTPQVEGYLSKVANEKARQIITAGGGDEQVIERDEWQHSAFTKNLIEGFDTWEADYNKDGCITADELSTYLRENVTEDSDFQQTPQDGRFRNSGGGEFVFFGTRDTQIEAEVSLIKEKQVEDAKDEQSINKYKYQITASTTLESLALDKKSERQLKSGGILAVSGFLFFIDTGSSSSNNILKVVGVIGSGIGILYNLAIKSKAEKKYNSIKDIDNKDEKEGLAYNHLVFLADEAKRNRQYKMVTHGAISAYSLINGTEKRDEWGDELRSNSSLYNGLLNGALAWYHYKVLSKEEKALENYSNQP